MSDGTQYWRSWSTKLAPHRMTEKGEQTNSDKSAITQEPENQTSIANRIRQNCKRWSDYARHHTPTFVQEAADATTPTQLGTAVNKVLDCINPPQDQSSSGGGGIWLNDPIAMQALMSNDRDVLSQAAQVSPPDSSLPLYNSDMEEVDEDEDEESSNSDFSQGGGTKKKRRRKKRTKRIRKYHKKTRKRRKKKKKKTRRRRRKRN